MFLAAFGSDVLAVGVTDTGEIAGEGFVLAKNDIWLKVKPTVVPVIDYFVDLHRQSATKAPAEIRRATVGKNRATRVQSGHVTNQ